MELYKKHRPSTFKQVIGHETTVKSLRRMIKSNQVPHAILLHGPSGCGKTTIARIISSKLGAENMDVMERNSADYRGIDSVRDMIDIARLAPMSGVRVVTLDEAHKLTNDAQNAFLKLLEDTPKSTWFILCTTNPEKLLKTIRTRCTTFQLGSLYDSDLKKLLIRTAKSEKIKMSDDHADDIVNQCEGAARTAMVYLDTLRHLDSDQWDEAIQHRLVDGDDNVIALCRALMSRKKWNEIRKILVEIKADPENVRWAILGYASSVLLKQQSSVAHLIIELFSDNFYDSKKAGLVAACYATVTMK